MGNALQRILHGGVIASVLDVAAGITCVTGALLRQPALSEQDLRHRLARMGTIDMRVDYLLPGHGEHFTITSHLLRGGNKISEARADLHNNRGVSSRHRHRNLFDRLTNERKYRSPRRAVRPRR